MKQYPPSNDWLLIVGTLFWGVVAVLAGGMVAKILEHS